MKREKMEYRLKKELDAARYAHTLGVEQTAREMARQFGEDEEKAALAGLLHDCAKCLPLSQMVKAAKDEKLDPVMKESKALMHAVAGMHLAQDVYDVHDPEVLGAIRASGRPLVLFTNGSHMTPAAFAAASAPAPGSTRRAARSSCSAAPAR